MIDYKIKYQAVIFLNASDILPNQKNISTLMNEFSDKELIPNTFQEFPNFIQLPSQPRFQLSSPNNEWVIRFGTARIDIEKNPVDIKGNNLGEVKEFCTDASIFFERILIKYPRQANRVALVTRFLLQEFTETKMHEIYTKLFNATKLYSENKPFEWNWRSVSKIKKTINKLEEEFNFITAINRAKGEFREDKNVSTLDRIELNFDINSLPTNLEARFGINSIREYYDSVYEWHDQIINELCDFIK